MTERMCDFKSGMRITANEAAICGTGGFSAVRQGHTAILLEGSFGERGDGFSGDERRTPGSPVITWRRNLQADPDAILEIHPEYRTEGPMRISLRVKLIDGESERVVYTRDFEEEALTQPIRVKGPETGKGCFVYLSLLARGEGRLRVGTLHIRRLAENENRGIVHSCFLNSGSEKIGEQTVKNEQPQGFMTRFEEGNRKPPFCVCFSDYRREKGFDGLEMLRKLGVPFLLVCDDRFEGGGFYLGDRAYEDALEQVIREKLAYLGFSEDQMILSGISMGAFGALYYGAKFSPAALILGKPILHVGEMILNEKRLRPGVFPASADLLHEFAEHGIGGASAERRDRGVREADARELDQHIRNRIEKGKFCGTRISVMCMSADDFDPDAYEALVKIMGAKRAAVFGRRMTGRHRDHEQETADWFANQHERMAHTWFWKTTEDGRRGGAA